MDVISSTPRTPRTAASTRWVICVSSSLGAAPGCEMVTLTNGKLTSGLLFTSIRMKLTSPASTRAANSTSGVTGLRIDHAEMLRKFITRFLHRTPGGRPLSCPAPHRARARLRQRPLASSGLTFCPGVRKAPADVTIFSVPVMPPVMATPASDTWPTDTSRRSTWFLPLTI